MKRRKILLMNDGDFDLIIRSLNDIRNCVCCHLLFTFYNSVIRFEKVKKTTHTESEKK